jgi:hypothetical protein
MTVTVAVQWALYGRDADARLRVLSCSTGKLNRDNFGEAIRRFSPGTPDALPQVTLSYVAADTPDNNYVALAIHKLAEDDGTGRPDETGRPVLRTSYFCLPYLPLANEAIGYLALYRALETVKLPSTDGPTWQITLTSAAATTAAPANGTLAKEVAALLFTGRPVCVLGAGSASLTDRLRFIDTVMGLLPYGSRAKMTAATWVRPTQRDHRFRLFFSDAARDHAPPDHLVWWDRREATVITPADGIAYEYQRFLEDNTRQPDSFLSSQTNPYGFKVDDLSRALADLGITEPTSGPAHDTEQANNTEQEHPPQPEQGAVSQDHDRCEAILAECAEHVKVPDLALLAADIRTLRQLATTTSPGLTDGQRERYREVIVRHGLLKANSLPEKQGARLFDALLLLIFSKPLTYNGYCQLEDCLGDPPGTAPSTTLLKAVERFGMADALVIAIVLTHLGQNQELPRHYNSPQFSADQLITMLAGRWERPQHFRIACDLTLDYLSVASSRYNLITVRRTLRDHGFLAKALLTSGSQDQYQVHFLYRLLQAAYPERLSRTAVTAILSINSPSPVTPALFAAVLMRLARPEDDAQLARDAYAVASLNGLGLDQETSVRIRRLLPVLDQNSGTFFKPRVSQPTVEHSGPDDRVPGPGT